MKRLLAITLALAAWVAGTVAGTIGTADVAAAPLLAIGRAHAEFAPSLSGDDPIFILVLGSDSRPGTPMDGGLSDSIHILGINPGKGKATLFGIPRDSYVPLASGGTGKINAAMPAGGPQATIATVEALTGIRFDYYMLTGFGGMLRAVDQIGGLTVDVPFAMDTYDHSFSAGPQQMNGNEALGFARTRKSLPRGDFDRSLNQGVLMVGALGQFRKHYAKDAGALFTWLGAGLRNVQLDIPLDELMRLANLAMQVKPNGVTNLVALGSSGSAGGSSIVNLSADNQALWQDMAADGYIAPKAVPDAARVQA